MITLDEKTLARFWAKVNKDGPVPVHRRKLGQCWIWTGRKNGSGYGSFGIKISGKWKPYGAHVASWILHTGELPLHNICHHCDDPACVNPGHFFCGTQRKNMEDSSAKGRLAGRNVPRGELVNTAKVCAAEVIEIRNLCKSGSNYVEVAKNFGLSENDVSQIARGLIWKHVGGPRMAKRNTIGENNGGAVLNESAVLWIRNNYTVQPGQMAHFAKKFGVSDLTIAGIVYGKVWKNVGGTIFKKNALKTSRAARDSKIRQLSADGKSRIEIMEIVGCGSGTVSRALSLS